ncbi:hypothetical protein D3C78_1650150 [compost metagenome]
MTGNRFIGLDTAVHAINSRNIRAESNTIVSREVAEAISSQDKSALIAALGLPADTPSALVGEALQTYARNAADERAAAQELSNSRLARFVGVAADLSQLVSAFAGLARSSMLASALALLFS